MYCPVNSGLSLGDWSIKYIPSPLPSVPPSFPENPFLTYCCFRGAFHCPVVNHCSDRYWFYALVVTSNALFYKTTVWVAQIPSGKRIGGFNVIIFQFLTCNLQFGKCSESLLDLNVNIPSGSAAIGCLTDDALLSFHNTFRHDIMDGTSNVESIQDFNALMKWQHSNWVTINFTNGTINEINSECCYPFIGTDKFGKAKNKLAH